MSFILKSDTTTITLPSPEQGDSYELSLDNIIRRTRGNVLKVFSDHDWLEEIRRTFIFNNIVLATLNNFILFISENAGQQIEYIDHLGVVSSGFITTTAFDMETRKDLCSYTVGFEILDVGISKTVNLDALAIKQTETVAYMDAMIGTYFYFDAYLQTTDNTLSTGMDAILI